MAARRTRKAATAAPVRLHPVPRDAAGPEPAELQPAYLAARFGLDQTRARLTAELAWGRQ